MKHLLLLIGTIFILSINIFAHTARITDHGAVPGVGDDTQAFRDALAAIEDECGGEIVVPKGEFLLTGEVRTDFYAGCGYIHLTIRGEAGAHIRVSVGAGNYGFVLTSLKSIKVENIVFLGLDVPPTHPSFTDAGTLFYLSSIDTTTIDRLFVYGLAVDSAIIKFYNTDLNIINSQFAGSTAYHPNGAYILGDNDGAGNGWQSLSAKNLRFLDYANYKYDYITKTPFALTGAYFRTKAPRAGGNAQTSGKSTYKDIMFDEGAYTAIDAIDTPFVDVEGVSVNLNGTVNATGIRLTNVESAIVTQSIADWFPGYFITTQNVGRIKVELLKMRAGAHVHRDLGDTYWVQGWCPGCDP